MKIMNTTNIKDTYQNLQRAAAFDPNINFSTLSLYLTYRKLLAQQILQGTELDKIKELEQEYEMANSQIKLLIGL